MTNLQTRTPFDAQYDTNSDAATPVSYKGTAGTNVTAYEYGTPYNRTTVLTLASVDVPDIAGGADLGVGALIYTFPAGEVCIRTSSMSVAIQQVDGNIDADQPEIGLGTVIASGAVAVLSGTATFENIITGQVAADCDGTATVETVDTQLVIATAAAHTVYLNLADGWAASGDANATMSGTVWINWAHFA